MKIVALYSIKGGVGKTSSAVNLAFIAASKGYRTLVWDLDPQGASSYYFRIKPKLKGGSKDLIAGKRELDGLIKGTDFENLDLLPSDFSFRNLDLILDTKKKPTQQLKKLLKPLVEEYDFIFLDCPPNISLLSEAVFEASDVLLSPIIPRPANRMRSASLCWSAAPILPVWSIALFAWGWSSAPMTRMTAGSIGSEYCLKEKSCSRTYCRGITKMFMIFIRYLQHRRRKSSMIY